MDNIDTERMKRVLGRVYPDREPGPIPLERPGHRDACDLLRREQALQSALQSVMGRSGECRRRLQSVYRRSAQRAQRLRAECFMHRGDTRPGRTSLPRGGVLTGLREIHRSLETLSNDYEKAAADEPRQHEIYMRFARECRADAHSVRALIDLAMR